MLWITEVTLSRHAICVCIIYFKDSSLAWPQVLLAIVGSIQFCSPLIDRTKEVSQNARLMNKNKTHCNGGLSPLPCQRFKKKVTSKVSAVEFKYPLFQLERNTKHNGRIFTRYPVNASENGDFNRGRKSFLVNTMLKILTRATEKTKRSWTYMRENGVDSPCLFLHWGFSMVASLEHPELFVEKKKKCLKRCGLIP